MSAKTFEGKVSVILNTKEEIALKRDPNGSWDASKAPELYAKMQELAKSKKKPINSYALFLVEGGTEVVLLANRFGNPYIAVLPKREGSTGTRAKVTKLA